MPTNKSWEEKLEEIFPKIISKYNTHALPRGIFDDIKSFISQIIQEGREDERVEIIKEIEKLSEEKRMILQQEGYGKVPVLFEDNEIVNLIKTKPKK